MEFDKDIAEKIKEAKNIANSVNNLSEEEKKIVFTQMVNKILDSKDIQKEVKKESIDEGESNNASKDIQELYHERKPKTNADALLLVAYNYHQKGKHFTVGEILENFKLLLLPPPSNPSDVINKQRKKGYLLVHGKNEERVSLFGISRKGLEYVEGGFQKNE